VNLEIQKQVTLSGYRARKEPTKKISELSLRMEREGMIKTRVKS
jgi:hypothetical protein